MTRVTLGPQPSQTGSTSWTLIGRVVHGEDWEKREALETLLQRYLPAIRAYVVARRWVKADDIDDTVHNFVESQLLDQQLLAKVNQEKGKFRSYLFTALRNFLINQFRKKELVCTPIETDLRVDCSPEHRFDCEWARLVINQAVEEMKQQCEDSRRRTLWVLFDKRVLSPIFDGTAAPSYKQMIQEVGLDSPTQAANLLVTAKRMFARVLRDVVAQYTLNKDDEQGIDDELDDLMRALHG